MNKLLRDLKIVFAEFEFILLDSIVIFFVLIFKSFKDNNLALAILMFPLTLICSLIVCLCIMYKRTKQITVFNYKLEKCEDLKEEMELIKETFFN